MKMLVKDSLSIASIFILFCLSFYQRQAHLTNDTDPNDVANLQILTTLDVWQQTSPLNYSFLPVQSYQNKGDVNIHYYKRFLDKIGNNYYISYPPLCYVIPYSFKFLGFDINRKLLVWINIFLHFIGSLFLFLLLKSILKTKTTSLNITISLAYFILTPVMLYSYGRMYFAETLGLSLFIACIFFLYQLIFINPKSKHLLLGFIVSFALLSYCEWISIFTSFGLVLFLFFQKTLDKKFRLKILFISSICLILPLIIFLLQILSLNSLSEGFHSLSIRLIERSGWFGKQYSSDGISIFDISSISTYFKNCINAIGILGLFIILIGLIFKFAFHNPKKENISQTSFILFLIFIPIIGHNIVFFNANAIHYHLQIKWIFLLSLIWAIVTSKKQLNSKLNILVQLSVLLFILINLFYTSRFEPKKNAFLDKIASEIIIQKETESALFANIESDPPTPYNLAYLSYITKRNFAFVNDTITAKIESKKLDCQSFCYIEGKQNNNSFTILKMHD